MSLFLTAVFLGLIYNALPGPVFAESMKRGLTGGYFPALYVQLGSLLGDSLWAVLGLMGIGLLMQIDSLRIPLGIFGSLYLFYLAIDCWQHSQSSQLASYSTDSSALTSGALISLTSPHNIAYWAAMGSALGSFGIHSPDWWDYSIFFAGFMASCIAWCFLCAGLIRLIAKKLNQYWTKRAYQFCAIFFLLFSINNLFSLFAN